VDRVNINITTVGIIHPHGIILVIAGLA